MAQETILLAADHAGFELKAKLEAELKKLGYSVKDFGTNSPESSDYADFARFLVQEGIDSMSLNPDTVVKTIIDLNKMK